ncbi:MAG: hypothetical protein ACXWQ5_01015 [Ktedonobacterales bacterium]
MRSQFAFRTFEQLDGKKADWKNGAVPTPVILSGDVSLDRATGIVSIEIYVPRDKVYTFVSRGFLENVR